jgi:hypothetical protein
MARISRTCRLWSSIRGRTAHRIGLDAGGPVRRRSLLFTGIERERGKMTALVAAILIGVTACGPPEELRVDVDAASLTDSPISRRVFARLTVGTDDNNQRALQRWLADECDIADRSSARECGLRLGMNCPDEPSSEPICSFSTTIRSRVPRQQAEGNRVWSTRTAYVELYFRDGEPVIDYRSESGEVSE